MCVRGRGGGGGAEDNKATSHSFVQHFKDFKMFF